MTGAFNTGGLTQSLRQQLISPAWQSTAYAARLPDPLQGSRTADRHAAAQSQPLLPELWHPAAEVWRLLLPATGVQAARLLRTLGLKLLLLLLLGQQIRLQLLASLHAAVLKWHSPAEARHCLLLCLLVPPLQPLILAVRLGMLLP